MLEAQAARVFISYSHADLAFAERLAADLRAHGIGYFIDQTGLEKGTEDWDNAIRRAVRTSSAVLLIASPTSRQSRYVRDELAVASMYRRRIYPIWASGEEWVDCVPLGMSMVQYVDARGERYQRGLAELVDALRRAAASLDASKGQSPPAEPTFEPRNPYKGLRPFTEPDAPDFFGRARAIDQLVEALRTATDELAGPPIRILVVVGPSGSGKSSVVMAGLLPRLKQREAVPGSQDWVYLDPVLPGSHPIESLAVGLARRLDRGVSAIRADLVDESARGLHTTASLLTQRRDQRVVVLLDQFEEIFTQTTDPEERRQLVDVLSAAVTERHGPVVVVVTLRADFYHRVMEYPDLWRLIQSRTCTVEPLGLDDLREVIEAPARLSDTQLTFEGNLVGDMLFEVRDRQRAVVGALPLLQFALDQLFQARDGHQLTERSYAAMGGVRGALAKHAEDVYQTLPSDLHRALARELFLRLIEPGSTEGEATRRRVAQQELELADADKRRVMQDAVEAFVNGRLLTTNAEQAGPGTVEVTHEALIHAWDRLRRWSDENQALQMLHRDLTGTAHEWDQRGRDPDLLYRGARLIEVEEWRAGADVVLNQLELAFLQASLDLRDVEHRQAEARRERELQDAKQLAGVQHRAATLLRWLAAVLALGLVLSLVAAGVAVAQQSEAVHQQQIATSRELAASADAQLGADPELSVMLALEATRELPTAQAELALRRAVGQSALRGTLLGHVGEVDSAAFSPQGDRVLTSGQDGTVRLWDTYTHKELRQFTANSKAVFSVAFSADGEQIVTAGQDGTARLWFTASGRVGHTLFGHSGMVRGASFRPDGAQVVTAGDDGTARIWDVSTGQEVRQLLGHTGAVRMAAFSPDGQQVVTGGDDATVRVWDANTGQELRRLESLTGTVFSAAFSPDGQRLVTAGSDFTAEVLDAHTLILVRTFFDHTGDVRTALFSQDGKRVVTAGADGTVRVWNVDSGQQLRKLAGHIGPVYGAAFSPNGQLVVSAGADGTARVWEPEDGQDFRQLLGHTAPVRSAAFSPTGGSVVTAGEDGTARTWSVDNGRELQRFTGHIGMVLSAAFGPEGRQVVTAGADGTARLWDANSGQELRQLLGHTGTVAHAVFSPDGELVATAGADGSARVWDANSGQELRRLLGHRGEVRRVAFSPDGRQLVTAGADGTAHVWDVQSGQLLRQLLGHTGGLVSAAVSPDARLLVSTGEDGTARLWDARSGDELRQLRGHIGVVFSAAFSPDSRLVVTAGQDWTVRVWDVQSAQQLLSFSRHQGVVSGAAFSPDGRYVVSSSGDNTARVWFADCPLMCALSDLQTFAQKRLARDFTSQERQQYLDQSPQNQGEAPRQML